MLKHLEMDSTGIFIWLAVPRPRVLPEFKRLAHGLRSSNISVLDAKTFYIPNLHYDGAGPDAYFFVGNGSVPNLMGIKVPNELGWALACLDSTSETFSIEEFANRIETFL
jgi:Electron transfer DM13